MPEPPRPERPDPTPPVAPTRPTGSGVGRPIAPGPDGTVPDVTHHLGGATVSVPLRPGDHVLVALNHVLTEPELAALAEQLRDWLPGVEVRLLNGATLLVVPAEVLP